jgi:hypothetical protein
MNLLSTAKGSVSVLGAGAGHIMTVPLLLPELEPELLPLELPLLLPDELPLLLPELEPELLPLLLPELLPPELPPLLLVVPPSSSGLLVDDAHANEGTKAQAASATPLAPSARPACSLFRAVSVVDQRWRAMRVLP